MKNQKTGGSKTQELGPKTRDRNERKNAHFIISMEDESIGIFTKDMRCGKRFLGESMMLMTQNSKCEIL